MKNIFLFSTKFRYYLTEIPLIFFLVISIIYNDAETSALKLYPLITILSVGIIVTFLYFFRGVSIGLEELRTVGLFSDRYHIVISDNDRLVITQRKSRKLKIELFTKSESNVKLYDWLKESAAEEINIFRATAIGSKRAIRKVLVKFGLTIEEANSLLSGEHCEFESKLASIKVSVNNGLKEYEIAMKALNINQVQY